MLRIFIAIYSLAANNMRAANLRSQSAQMHREMRSPMDANEYIAMNTNVVMSSKHDHPDWQIYNCYNLQQLQLQ
jgi:hypothetical protein